MGGSKLSEIRARNAERRENLMQLKLERAQSAVTELISSDQFKMSILASPNNQMAISQVAHAAATAVSDPVGDLLDTLRSKGFRPAEIRKLVHKLYNMYVVGLEEQTSDVVYEDILEPVAFYVCEHQELYNTLEPESLRS